MEKVEQEKLGRLAVCTHGKIGRVDEIKISEDDSRLYLGTNIITGGDWQSKCPTFLSESAESFFNIYVHNIEDLLERGLELLAFTQALEQLDDEVKNQWLSSLGDWSEEYLEVIQMRSPQSEDITKNNE